MGNNANGPLIRTIAEGSGGFWTAVSNADDVVGQLVLAKSKIRYEALRAVGALVGVAWGLAPCVRSMSPTAAALEPQ